MEREKDEPRRRKDMQEIAVQIEPSCFEEIFGGLEQPDAEEAAEPAETEGGEQTDAAPDSEVEAVTEKPSQLLFENPEACAREWINLYAAKQSASDPTTTVVDFSPGTGVNALAAAREMVRYTGLWLACICINVQQLVYSRFALCGAVFLPRCLSDSHRDVIIEFVTLAIVLELVQNKRDGFGTSRFLSRERSLGAGAAAETPQDLWAVDSQEHSHCLSKGTVAPAAGFSHSACIATG